MWSDNQMELCNTDLPRGLKKTLEKYCITVGFFYTHSAGPPNKTEYFFSPVKNIFTFTNLKLF